MIRQIISNKKCFFCVGVFMCLRKICNVKSFVSVFLMVLIVGTSLFGAKKHEVKKDLHPCKTKSIKPQPEEKIIKLDPVIDKKLIEKKRERKNA